MQVQVQASARAPVQALRFAWQVWAVVWVDLGQVWAVVLLVDDTEALGLAQEHVIEEGVLENHHRSRLRMNPLLLPPPDDASSA